MPRHYKTYKGYRKSQAYIHIHDVPHKHHNIAYIGGKVHHVKRSRQYR